MTEILKPGRMSSEMVVRARRKPQRGLCGLAMGGEVRVKSSHKVQIPVITCAWCGKIKSQFREAAASSGPFDPANNESKSNEIRSVGN